MPDSPNVLSGWHAGRMLWLSELTMRERDWI